MPILCLSHLCSPLLPCFEGARGGLEQALPHPHVPGAGLASPEPWLEMGAQAGLGIAPPTWGSAGAGGMCCCVHGLLTYVCAQVCLVPPDHRAMGDCPQCPLVSPALSRNIVLVSLGLHKKRTTWK